MALPLVLGAAILLWTYHDFDFRRVWSVLDGGMNYGWMAFFAGVWCVGTSVPRLALESDVSPVR